MRHSESLIAFLGNRKNKAAIFYLGHWLAAIEDDALEQLRSLSKQFMDGAIGKATDDVLSVGIHAMAAESRKPQLKLAPAALEQLVGTLYIAASLESYRRRGWLELEATLSIKPHKRLKLRITELGRQSGDALLQRLH